MTLGKILKTGALITSLALVGCGESKEPAKYDNGLLKIFPTTPTRADTTTAFDGSLVLVIPDEDNGFIFYRDKNRDGLADTFGRGFYMMGLSQRTSEDSLYRKENMVDLMSRNSI